MTNRILFCVEEEFNPASITPSLALTATEKVTRLYSIEVLIKDFRTADPQVSTRYNNDEDLFEKEVFPRLPQEEKAMYHTFLMECESATRAGVLIEQLEKLVAIKFAQYDELNEAYDLVPNDPKYNQQWGLAKIGCEAAWDLSLGTNIIVAVVDSGVDHNHPDIAQNMWKNSAGHYGYDFSGNSTNTLDINGHGTHVAGTIAALTNNMREVAGVAPSAKIMAVKIFPDAYDAVCARAIKYTVDNGAKVINCSWGPRTVRPSNPTIETAIEYAYNKGAVVVFAAGNSNDDVTRYSPANFLRVISVGASDRNDKRANFSNWGKNVRVAAPGVDILSLSRNSGGSHISDGTSMAAPHVSGLIALILKINPTYSFDILKYFIVQHADAISTDKPVGKRINAGLTIRNVEENLLRIEATISHSYSGVSGCASSAQSEAGRAATAWAKKVKQQYAHLRYKRSGHSEGIARNSSGRRWDQSRWCKTTVTVRCYIEFYKS
jgi:thermitase